MHPITKQSELAAFCAQVDEDEFITVDTEFIRDKTYFPKLCLIQIAGDKHAAVIDPLAKGIDLKPVFALLQKSKVTKVFHACRQDIEIFYLLSGKIPHPVFDTQVAAAVCGYGESVSYETLVNKIVGSELDKSSRFTDWSARPLNDKQLAYALSDVTHLRKIYIELKNEIEKAGRVAWIAEEHAHLANPALYEINPDEAWKRLKFGNMRPKSLAALRELARWRETEAKKADVPRGRIIKDDMLIELAHALPRKEVDLSRLRNIQHLGKAKTDTVLECVNRALELPQSDWPQVKHHKRLPENVAGCIAMLQLLLKVKADAHGIASSIIAGKEDLEMIALGLPESPALQGWRYDIFGHAAQQLMAGKLRLSLDPKKGKVIFEES